MHAIHYRYADIDGQRLFYREAGAAGAPALVLLHGFPASSFMFRDLIPLLADLYHVIAPDHLGFGLSAAPPASEFTYTFDALAELTAHLLDQLGLTRYAMYVHDYGAPVGWRLALAAPDAITAIITQNGNGYKAGFGRRLLAAGAGLLAIPRPADRGGRPAGADPGGHPVAVPARRPRREPGQSRHLAARLPPRYPGPATTWSSWPYLPTTPPTSRCTRSCMPGCATAASRCWPCGAATTRSSAQQGALAFADDAPSAEICLLDGGHFLLESHLDTAAATIRHFLERRLP